MYSLYFKFKVSQLSFKKNTKLLYSFYNFLYHLITVNNYIEFGLFYCISDNLLGISWHDSAWIPILNAGNVLDYFSERSNPFYDRTCNNEIVKMQRLSPEQLKYVFISIPLYYKKLKDT